MALCGYCGKVEIAWHQTGGQWIAYHAQRDSTGAIIKREVKNGKGYKVLRPVADTTKLHYPHLHWIAGATREASECVAWNPSAAAASMRGRKGSRTAKAFAALKTPLTPSSVTDITPELLEGLRKAGLTSMADDLTRRAAGLVGIIPPPSGVSIPSAGTIATGGVGEAETIEAEGPEDDDEPGALPEPEELIGANAMAAWARARKAIECPILPTRVLLWGPPGTGKTELGWRIAQEHGWTHIQQQMTEETPGTELTGHLIVQGGNTVWCDGTLGRAIRASHEGHVVYVIDEVARASQDAMSACLLALTNPESLRLTLRSGEVLAPKVDHWHVVATSNDEPRLLPTALGDRLHISVLLAKPHPDLVRSMTTAEARRLATAESREYSVRALLTYDRLRAGGMTLEDAANIVWEPAVASSFADAVRLEASK